MDELDAKILNYIQTQFPIDSRPYDVIANKVGSAEKTVFGRIRSLKRRGIIRRIGGNFDSKKLGFVTSLIAMKVPEKKLETTAEIINRYPNVTHNYQRNDEFSLWFTLIAKSKRELECLLREIRRKTGMREILKLDAKRVFKISVNFQIEAIPG